MWQINILLFSQFQDVSYCRGWRWWARSELHDLSKGVDKWQILARIPSTFGHLTNCKMLIYEATRVSHLWVCLLQNIWKIGPCFSSLFLKGTMVLRCRRLVVWVVDEDECTAELRVQIKTYQHDASCERGFSVSQERISLASIFTLATFKDVIMLHAIRFSAVQKKSFKKKIATFIWLLPKSYSIHRIWAFTQLSSDETHSIRTFEVIKIFINCEMFYLETQSEWHRTIFISITSIPAYETRDEYSSHRSSSSHFYYFM